MEGNTARLPRQAGESSSRRQDYIALLVLLLLAAGIRTWLLCHTEVAARDSIGFIRIAWQLEHEPFGQVLEHAEQHPGYPLLILLASLPVRCFSGGPEAVIWQFSAQLVSVVAGTLLVVPTYYLGRELFSRTAGFWASVLFQCLPASCRVLSDGLSEATFLLFAVTALYLAARALRGDSPLLCGLCGLFSALAYLTRPEGALIAAATGAVLLVLQVSPTWRRSWRGVLTCGASLVLASAVVGSPIVIATGHLTVKHTANVILDPAGRPKKRTALSQGRVEEGVPASLARRPPLVASLLAIWQLDDRQGSGHIWWGLRALGYEILKGFNYSIWLPALLGLWWFRSRLRLVPGAWVLLVMCSVLALLLWRVAAVMGYVSERHTLLILLSGSYWAVAAVVALGRRLVAIGQMHLPRRGLLLSTKLAGRVAMVALLLALVGPALPKSLEPLHFDRQGFRQVGLWLGDHTQLSDPIADPYAWANYYAGRVFHEKDVPAPSPGQARTEYVVLEQSRNPHTHLPKHHAALEECKGGQEVYRWSGRRGKEQVSVVVYAKPPGKP